MAQMECRDKDTRVGGGSLNCSQVGVMVVMVHDYLVNIIAIDQWHKPTQTLYACGLLSWLFMNHVRSFSTPFYIPHRI